MSSRGELCETSARSCIAPLDLFDRVQPPRHQV